jgi:hypothetical protein
MDSDSNEGGETMAGAGDAGGSGTDFNSNRPSGAFVELCLFFETPNCGLLFGDVDAELRLGTPNLRLL